MKQNKKFPVDTLLFLVDTSEFDNFTMGVYTRLLFTQWENRDLPNDFKSLANITKCTEEEFKAIWPFIKHKFIKKEDGRLYNLRVEETRLKQDKTSYGKSNGGKAGAEAKKRKGKDLKVIVFPWDTTSFKEKWILWKAYKKESWRFNYKTAVSEQAALNSLSKIAQNEAQAIELILYAIGRQWQAIFLPSNYEFKDGTITAEKSNKSGKDKGTYNPEALNAINKSLKSNK